jgi:uncharacterized protein YbjQ (UPF0145 family)
MVRETRDLVADAVVDVCFSTSRMMGGAAELPANGTAAVLFDG